MKGKYAQQAERRTAERLAEDLATAQRQLAEARERIHALECNQATVERLLEERDRLRSDVAARSAPAVRRLEEELALERKRTQELIDRQTLLVDTLPKVFQRHPNEMSGIEYRKVASGLGLSLGQFMSRTIYGDEAFREVGIQGHGYLDKLEAKKVFDVDNFERIEHPSVFSGAGKSMERLKNIDIAVDNT